MMTFRLAMIGIGVALMLLLMPVSIADDQNHDMADRIYEKFKEREREKRDRKPREQSQKEDRRDTRQKTRSSTERSSRQTTRENREYVDSRARSDRRRSQPEYRSSARDDRRTREAGEQISQGIRDLMKRKSSQQRESSSRSTSNRSTTGRSTTERYVRPSTNSRLDSRSSARVSSDNQDTMDKVSLDQAVNIVRRQSKGTVISARSEGSGTTRKHRIKVLIDDRRVRTYVVSAATGKVY